MKTCSHCGGVLDHGGCLLYQLQARICTDAWDRGCGIALVNAIQFCRSYDDLLTTMCQAAGVGSEGLQRRWVPAVEIAKTMSVPA